MCYFLSQCNTYSLCHNVILTLFMLYTCFRAARTGVFNQNSPKQNGRFTFVFHEFQPKRLTFVLICLCVFTNVIGQLISALYHRLSGRRTSLFTQELATLVFGTLAKATLTGKGKKGELKEQLEPEKNSTIKGTVIT